MIKIVLVTPVWNDCARLAKFGQQLASALAVSDLTVTWVIADDGSSSEEVEKLRDLVELLRETFVDVVLFECGQRFRKGGAIYQAWGEYTATNSFAFVDADGAIQADTVIELLKSQSADPQSAYVGIRKDSASAPVNRPPWRSLSFRIFALLVRLLTGAHFQDTQCGLKVIPAAVFRSLEAKLLERGFVFDVELLVALKAQGVVIVERSIPWCEMPDGKVSPLRDAWGMVGGLLCIRKRIRSGHYSAKD